MSSIFSALTRISSATVDAVMGENLRFVPMKPGRYKGKEVDAGRIACDCSGVYRELVKRTKLDTSQVGREVNTQVIAPQITFSVETDALAGNRFVAGDLITRRDEPGEPTYEISASEGDGGTRILFTVTVVNQ